MRIFGRTSTALICSLGLVVGAGGAATADQYSGGFVDADTVKVGNNITYQDPESPGQHACSDRGGAVSGSATLLSKTTGAGAHFADGATLSVSGSADPGISVSGSNFSLPNPWTAGLTQPFSYNTTVSNGVAQGVHTVTLSVSDGTNAVSTTYTVSVESACIVASSNTAPSVLAGGPYSGDEGSNIQLDGAAVSDADNDSTTYSWTYTHGIGVDAGGSCTFSAPAVLQPDFSCTDDGTYTATLTVDDGHSHVVSNSATVNVSNASPVASITPASPPSSPEGTQITLQGGATDPGINDTLGYAWTVTKDGSSYAQSTSQNLSFTPDDNGTYAALLTVTDDDDGQGSNGVDIAVTNVNPIVASITPTPTDACSVSLSAAFSDPGTADTHTAVINWGDLSSGPAAVNEGNGAGTVSGSHTYSGPAGIKTITLAVTDDDRGSHSQSTTFETKNTPSSFLAPINTGTAQRSVFKLGSTVPVKIAVKDCSNNVVSTLSPVVQLLKVDSVPDGAVNETQIVEVPSNGKTMRWDGAQYIFNLSTKNSQLTGGGALSQGSYRLWITDSSFSNTPTVYFDLK